MFSVSQMAGRFGLSRTTILYYESCGLLKPAHRTSANYRLYGEKETRVLEQICLYRSVGLSVSSIRAMLASPETDVAALLRRRLRELDSWGARADQCHYSVARAIAQRPLSPGPCGLGFDGLNRQLARQEPLTEIFD